MIGVKLPQKSQSELGSGLGLDDAIKHVAHQVLFDVLRLTLELESHLLVAELRPTSLHALGEDE